MRQRDTVRATRPKRRRVRGNLNDRLQDGSPETQATLQRELDVLQSELRGVLNDDLPRDSRKATARRKRLTDALVQPEPREEGDPLRLELTLTPAQEARLTELAQERGLSLGAFCTQLLASYGD